MALEESDECDYCRGKGWYLMDGKKETCFCVGEKRMNITDKDLLAIERNTLNTENARAMARELRAARKVVRAAKRWVAAKTDAPEDFDALTYSIAAYDKARNSKA
jgi:hypothetical protein